MTIENIREVTVIGAGIMGEGIAQNFAQAGLSVRLLDREKSIVDTCLRQIDANLNLMKEFDLFDEEASRVRERIRPFLSKDLAGAVEGCDFIITTVIVWLAMHR